MYINLLKEFSRLKTFHANKTTGTKQFYSTL